MFNLVVKILKTPKTVIEVPMTRPTDILVVGEQIHAQIKRLFQGSLAIRQVDAGSDNACEQELVALSNAFYDVERFGIHFVASPRHADMLLVTGPVTRNMAEALRHSYDATPNPKIVVAVGDDALDGGIFQGSYATFDGVNTVVPVAYGIPGDPPTPMIILQHLLEILESVESSTITKKAR